MRFKLPQDGGMAEAVATVVEMLFVDGLRKHGDDGWG